MEFLAGSQGNNLKGEKERDVRQGFFGAAPWPHIFRSRSSYSYKGALQRLRREAGLRRLNRHLLVLSRMTHARWPPARKHYIQGCLHSFTHCKHLAKRTDDAALNCICRRIYLGNEVFDQLIDTNQLIATPHSQIAKRFIQLTGALTDDAAYLHHVGDREPDWLPRARNDFKHLHCEIRLPLQSAVGLADAPMDFLRYQEKPRQHRGLNHERNRCDHHEHRENSSVIHLHLRSEAV